MGWIETKRGFLLYSTWKTFLGVWHYATHGALYAGPTNKMSKEQKQPVCFCFKVSPYHFIVDCHISSLTNFHSIFLIRILFIHYNVARKNLSKIPSWPNLIMLNSPYGIQSRVFTLAYEAFTHRASVYSIPPHTFSAVATASSLHISMLSLLSSRLCNSKCALPYIIFPILKTSTCPSNHPWHQSLHKVFPKNHCSPIGAPTCVFSHFTLPCIPLINTYGIRL